MLGNQRLIGRYHVLTIGYSSQHQLLGGVITTNQFNQDIDIRIVGDIKDITGHIHPRRITGRIIPPRANLLDFYTASQPPGNFLAVPDKYVHGSTADCSQPTDAYSDRFQTGTPLYDASTIRRLFFYVYCFFGSRTRLVTDYSLNIRHSATVNGLLNGQGKKRKWGK
ncbi:hypothetical protein ElyMa_006320600 [Elysia marginata]|uniref:Uncharacterized protein n=1 Tax=Elysia marginata TaxID=1093978 RepID=A0AAV4HJS2_9GAST|nr:hypothetical protein ElyMa_006320600 [Elysia marginata]